MLPPLVLLHCYKYTTTQRIHPLAMRAVDAMKRPGRYSPLTPASQKLPPPCLPHISWSHRGGSSSPLVFPLHLGLASPVAPSCFRHHLISSSK